MVRCRISHIDSDKFAILKEKRHLPGYDLTFSFLKNRIACKLFEYLSHLTFRFIDACRIKNMHQQIPLFQDNFGMLFLMIYSY